MFAVVYNHVRTPLKRAIEAMLMELKLGKRMVEIPPFLQVYVEQGEIKAARIMLLLWAKEAGLVLSDEHRRRIETCTDFATIMRWGQNVVHARTADDVFGQRHAR
jgi:hypothetical protein